MKEVTLPSGAILRITPAPFADAKALYQAVMAEARGIELSSSMQFMEIAKNLVCVGVASRAVDAALAKCLSRCTYNNEKLEDKTFEPAEARADYTMVCAEVMEENLLPFFKSLSVVFERLLSMVDSSLQ